MNKLKKYLFCFLLSAFCYSFSNAQSIYEPIYNKEIYNFLDKQAEKGIIKLFDDIRPITRNKIARKLIAIAYNTDRLTKIEQSQLDFYSNEYAFEIKFINNEQDTISEFFNFGVNNRFNVFKYCDKNFAFDIDPVFQIKYDITKKNYLQYGGVKFKGRISDFLGFYFSYRDFMEDGENIDNFKLFTPLTGVKNHRMKLNKHSEYSETRGGVNLGWKWGNFTFAKDFLHIGSSYQASVILSNKAPSFPHIRLEIEPVSWFKYNFIHAWLDSKLIDSTTIRYTGVESEVLDRSVSYSRRFKYYVSHTFSFMPFNNWWLTFGESIIYGDRLEPIYFIPLFFRLADHYNSIGGADTGDNAQIFFNTSYIWTKIKSKIYFSFYIDEMSIEQLLSGNGDNAQVFAWTFGGRFTNPIWQDSYFTFEYNAIKPYAYMNADPLQQYTSSDYQLGHWIGSNAVQYYFLFEQYFSRAIKLEASYQYILKGAKEDINDYYNRVTSTYPLLSGVINTFSEMRWQLSYNPIHDLFFDVDYSYIFKANNRFIDEYKITPGSSFSISLRYGY